MSVPCEDVDIPFYGPPLLSFFSSMTRGLTGFGDGLTFQTLWSITAAFGLVPSQDECNVLRRVVLYSSLMQVLTMPLQVYQARKYLRAILGYLSLMVLLGSSFVLLGAWLLLSGDTSVLRAVCGIFFLIFSATQLGNAAWARISKHHSNKEIANSKHAILQPSPPSTESLDLAMVPAVGGQIPSKNQTTKNASAAGANATLATDMQQAMGTFVGIVRTSKDATVSSPIWKPDFLPPREGVDLEDGRLTESQRLTSSGGLVTNASPPSIDLDPIFAPPSLVPLVIPTPYEASSNPPPPPPSPAPSSSSPLPLEQSAGRARDTHHNHTESPSEVPSDESRDSLSLPTTTLPAAKGTNQRILGAWFPSISEHYSSRCSLAFLLPASCAGGLLAGLIGAGGPPLMAAYSTLQLDKEVLRGFGAVPSSFMVLRMAMYLTAKGNVFNPAQEWTLYLTIGGCAVAGSYAGGYFRKYVDSKSISLMLVGLVFLGSALMLNIFKDPKVMATYASLLVLAVLGAAALCLNRALFQMVSRLLQRTALKTCKR